MPRLARPFGSHEICSGTNTANRHEVCPGAGQANHYPSIHRSSHFKLVLDELVLSWLLALVRPWDEPPTPTRPQIWSPFVVAEGEERPVEKPAAERTPGILRRV